MDIQILPKNATKKKVLRQFHGTRPSQRGLKTLFLRAACGRNQRNEAHKWEPFPTLQIRKKCINQNYNPTLFD